jgi:hypothetical protein
VFLSATRSLDPRSGVEQRHHLNGTSVQKAVAGAAIRAGIVKPCSPHILRHSFATRLLQAGHDIRTVQERPDHSDVSTTMIHTQVLKRGGRGVRGPFDQMQTNTRDGQCLLAAAAAAVPNIVAPRPSFSHQELFMIARPLVLALVTTLACASGTASAKGCLKGAVVGAVGGHLAGRHSVIGAAAGCAVGHHLANKKDKKAAEQARPQGGTAPAAPARGSDGKSSSF